VPAFGVNDIQIRPGAAPAVGVEVRVHTFPKRTVAPQHRQKLITHISRTAQMTVGEQGADPEGFPTQRQVAVVVDCRRLEVLAENFQLRVIKKNTSR
jgi:hypothetical protein